MAEDTRGGAARTEIWERFELALYGKVGNTWEVGHARRLDAFFDWLIDQAALGAAGDGPPVWEALSDVVDACYTEGTSKSWKLCQVCDMEYRPEEPYPGDQTHRPGCVVDVAERWLRRHHQQRSVSLPAPPNGSHP